MLLKPAFLLFKVSPRMLKSSFIADAAIMPLHWFYDQSKLVEKVPDGNAAFYSPPSCPFYSYPAGVFSPYGDESLPLARSIASVGDFNLEASSEAMYEFFKAYPNAEEKGYAGRLNHAPKSFVEARSEGKAWSECSQEDFQANGLTKVPLIVARYAGDANLLNRVKEMVGILQSHQLSQNACALYAKVLENAVLNPQHPRDVLTNVLQSVELTQFERNVLSFVTNDAKIAEWVDFTASLTALELSPEETQNTRNALKANLLNSLLDSSDLDLAALLLSNANAEGGDSATFKRFQNVCADVREGELTVNQVASSIGLSCALPGALLNALYIARKATDLREAINWNIMAGGDNCSRGMSIGALFGAYKDEIPEEWVSAMKPELWSEIVELSDKITSAAKK